MSSVQRGTGGGSAFELGSKKKFGKNLNKLQKPPPPITNGTTQKGSSRNGLLLLSTKRSTSTGNGLLSNKPIPPPVPVKSMSAARNNETYASTHEALVEAVMGASRCDAQKEPDAWGGGATVEKQPIKLEEPKEVAPAPERPLSQPVNTSMYNDFDHGFQPDKYNYQQPCDRYSGLSGRQVSDDSWRRTDTEENWRRETTPPTGDDQVQYMTKLARERAERKREEEEARMNEQRERAAERLIELEQKTKQATNANVEEKALSPPRTLFDPNKNNLAEATVKSPRTLYDPNVRFSSLLEASPRTDVPESRNQEVTVRQIRTQEDPQPEGPVIHLSSYEDRDRGERTDGTGPRMLYDPKSGSMVAVGDNSNNKSKKGKQKVRRETEKGDNGDAVVKKKGKVQQIVKKDRRGDSMDLTEEKPCKLRPTRLPRTCGILYLRDEKGNCYSADGCDGDQGYGCHGVPGGRIRNPTEYAKFQEQQVAHEDENPDDYEMVEEDDQDSSLLQGYTAPESATQEQVIDWVKRNEKIELLTGVQDSPTLRSTAVEWRPSSAALAAAQELKNSKEKGTTVSAESTLAHSADEREEEDSVDDVDAFMGLGFDPSNMDSVMSSPSIRGHSARLDAVDLISLTLGEGQSDVQTKNIFAFDTSATWGSSGTSNGPSFGGTTSTWGSNTSRVSGDTFGGPSSAWGVLTSANRSEAQEKGSVGTPSFLSLSTNNTWGSAGLPGFGADRGTAGD